MVYCHRLRGNYGWSNASVSVFGVKAEGFGLMALNEVEHLEGGG